MNKAEHYLTILADLQASQDHAANSLARLRDKARRIGRNEDGWAGLAADLSSYKLALIAAKAHCLHLEALLAEGVLKNLPADAERTGYLQ